MKVFSLLNVRSDDPSHLFQKLGDAGELQEFAFTLFDRHWVHLVNGSDWANVGIDAKLGQLDAFLQDPALPVIGETGEWNA